MQFTTMTSCAVTLVRIATVQLCSAIFELGDPLQFYITDGIIYTNGVYNGAVG